jgi:hypothetical protein
MEKLEAKETRKVIEELEYAIRVLKDELGDEDGLSPDGRDHVAGILQNANKILIDRQ